MDQKELEAALQASVGLSRGPYLGWDTVNRAMIRHWCEAMGDENPAYRNPNAAQLVGGHSDGVVAPATMLQAWTMVGFNGEHPEGSDTNHPVPVLDLFDQAGYKAVVATNCEQEYFAPVREGDDLRNYSVIESISGQKTTGLGVGYFVTQLMQFKNQREELVGEMRFRILKYKPH
ncbi:MAG: MaoC family dehydratase N-terminal domain-containing protein [Pseudomonadales bacterium]